MSDLSIFVSCGQFTPEERKLGKAIVQMVDGIPGMKAYFAEEVQDLNGLQANILAKLQGCDGFITVMHPRGDIKRLDGSVLTRASAWIEQEIGIATYIQQIEKRPLPVIAFKHRSVGLEGIRSLIQLNPTEFSDDMEVLAALPGRLESWKTLSPSGIHAEVRSSLTPQQHSGHEIRDLLFSVVNDSARRFSEFTAELRVPAGILKHWGKSPNAGNLTGDDKYEVFRLDEHDAGVIQPHTVFPLRSMNYCKHCAIVATGDPMLGADAVDNYQVEIKVWIDGREYLTAKTMKQLLIEASKT